MSKELVLLPKRKYEDLIQQKGEGESAPALENERLINISPPSGETNGPGFPRHGEIHESENGQTNNLHYNETDNVCE